MQADPTAEKAELRKTVRQALRRIDPAQLKQWSDRITARLLELPEYQKSKALMVYFSLPGEYATDALIDDAVGSGKTVCAPNVIWRTHEMYPVMVVGRDNYVVGDHGVKQPGSDQRFQADRLDLILVPGLAFDAQGRRLGRGGGFYDMLLGQSEIRATKLAAAFDLQIVENLPVADHDQPVDMIVTPTRVQCI